MCAWRKCVCVGSSEFSCACSQLFLWIGSTRIDRVPSRRAAISQRGECSGTGSRTHVSKQKARPSAARDSRAGRLAPSTGCQPARTTVRCTRRSVRISSRDRRSAGRRPRQSRNTATHADAGTAPAASRDSLSCRGREPGFRRGYGRASSASHGSVQRQPRQEANSAGKGRHLASRDQPAVIRALSWADSIINLLNSKSAGRALHEAHHPIAMGGGGPELF